MLRFGVYLVGLLLVLVAVYVLLTQTGLAAILPAGLIAVALLLLLGIGLMRAPPDLHHDHHDHVEGEVVETRQRVGDTEIRRTRLP
jgi:uncharacterized protein (DUF58 family)